MDPKYLPECLARNHKTCSGYDMLGEANQRNMAEIERLKDERDSALLYGERLRAVLMDWGRGCECPCCLCAEDRAHKIVNEQSTIKPKAATLEELETLLNSEGDDEIEILPDGSCRKIDPKGAKPNTDGYITQTVNAPE